MHLTSFATVTEKKEGRDGLELGNIKQNRVNEKFSDMIK